VRQGRSACRWLAGLSLLLVSLVLWTGCASQGDLPAVEPPSPIEERVSLGPGDEIELRFFYNPDLNDMQQIRPDGKISLPLIGEVMAYGRTPAGLEADLKKRYAPFMDQPEVTVIVRALNSRAVYVGGAVLQPGRVAMPGRLTLLSALMEAGGVDAVTASSDRVYLIRHDLLGVRRVEELDLDDAMRGETVTYLEPRDIVIVPRSTIVNVNQWIEQHINKMVPQFGFTYARESRDGRDRVGIDTSR
jgi:polysaccharide biosynthesis/export protein